MKQLYNIFITPGVSFEAIGDVDLGLHLGEKVVVSCERYQDQGSIQCFCRNPPVEDAQILEQKHAQQTRGRHLEGQTLPVILRRATTADLKAMAENRILCKNYQKQALQCIRAHKLPMKLIASHLVFDRKMLIFQFTAEGRIDFRELLRDLSQLFRMRVELRQVGVRDEAALLGGIGTCGRPLCCATFMPTGASVNVRSAKRQGLSLNPQSISGVCGRLKCCLQFESEETPSDRPRRPRRPPENADNEKKDAAPHHKRRRPPSSNSAPKGPSPDATP